MEEASFAAAGIRPVTQAFPIRTPADATPRNDRGHA
jgi:hypothetical protein